MKNVLASKVSYFILTLFFIVIIVSFLFSGNGNMFSSGTSGQEVANVNGQPITLREFQTALNNQIQFFSKMMGNNNLTEKQLEQMGIKQSVLNGLIQQKLLLNFANESKIKISLKEIKEEIKKLPYFKTNDQFDVNLYKNLLLNNKLTPKQFEEMVADDLKGRKMNQIFQSLLLSKNFVKDTMKFKNKKLQITGVKISRQSLIPLIKIKDDEIEAFIKNPENKNRLDKAYEEKSDQYKKPEQVRARHILIKGSDEKALDKIKQIRKKVTPKNFAKIASSATEDNSGKNNGGQLGWFSRGRMVPQFEKVAFNLKKGDISQPVKTPFGYHIIFIEDKKEASVTPLKDVERELAVIELQKSKSQKLTEILSSTQEDLRNHLKNNHTSKIKSLVSKVEGDFYENSMINFYDQKIESTTFSQKEIKTLFSSQAEDIIDFGNPGTIFLIKILKRENDTSITMEDLNKEFEASSQSRATKVRNELIKHLNNNAKIVTNQRLL